MEGTLKQIHSAEEIESKIKEMAEKITREYIGDDPVLAVCVLQGAVMFFTELVKNIKSDKLRFAVVSASSYCSVSDTKMASSGTVNIKFNSVDPEEARGMKVLIIEDIIDTGRTLKALKAYYNERGIENVKIATLIDKQDCRQVDFQADYTVFKIKGNPYLVGYGLDCQQYCRNLNGIYELKSN